MLIQRVVIQGFKTFARRTEFVFDPGVTAIVGPNGSGKSNVVDAIRWCLGEQSFSLLRSKKTSDVIFSGSDQKSRLGMAQVSLTLDNRAGELPVEFAEVEIARRAYRDGDNEYLLNGQRVRLQDITDILAQTGLGRRTYAVVGQGLIDRVLSLAPEELRSLFEEAAGIAGYQAKRVVSLRRLDAAQQNLTRVQDITAELGPRLGYLRRQAERAREREQIAGDLRILLREWYGYHWHSTLKELERTRGLAAGLRIRVDAHQTELTVVGREVETLRSRQTEQRAALGELHRTSGSRHREAEVAGRELAVAQERLRQVVARAEEARRELAPLRVQAEALSARITETEAAIATAHTSFAARQASADEMQSTVTRLQQERRQLQETLSQARRHVNQLQHQHAEARSRVQQLGERVPRLQQERADLARTREAAHADAQVATTELDTVAVAEAEHRARQAALQAQTTQVEAELAGLRSELETAQQLRQQAERDADRLQTRLDVLSRLQHEGAGYAGGVRAVLQAGRTGKPALGGILGTVASLVQVPPDLEKAIETALGGAFQNVVTRTWADAQAAIDFLKRTGQGRATFLPLDRLYVQPRLPAPRQAGILGNAADLVQYDPSVDAAVLQLLNRVWVAVDLDAARRALDGISSGPRPTVVTLTGDIVRPGGAVTGGGEPTQRDESVLAREREIRDLPALLAKAETVARTRAQASHELSTRIESLTSSLLAQQDAYARLDREERDRRTQVEELNRRMDRAHQNERWHAERLERVEAEIASLQRDSEALHAEIERQAAAITHATTELTQTEATAEAAGGAQLLAELADLRAAAAEARGYLQSHLGLLEDQQRSLHETSAQAAAKEEQIAQLEGESAAIHAQIERAEQQEKRLSRELDQLRAAIEPIEAALAELDVQQAALEVRERAAQEALRQDESAWHAAQFQVQRADDQLKQLRDDIGHELGLVSLEQSEEVAYQPPLPWETIVDQLPVLEALPPGLEDEVRDTRARLSRVNNVNPDAPREYAEASGRYEHLVAESEDLTAAIAGLRKVIRELDQLMEAELRQTFAAVSEQFVEYFGALFGGGYAKLVLTAPDDLPNTGIEIIARPPGKRPQSLALLSGGERTLTACALIFAILRVSPTPFCVLDEVDAALDEANVDRFRQNLTGLSQTTQFIIITHNRRTLEGANAIYGVTMASDGASRVISLRLEGERIVRGEAGRSPEGQGETPDDGGLAEIEEVVKL